MANEKTLEEMAEGLSSFSRGQLLAALHKTALRYAAMSEKKAKHKASADKESTVKWVRVNQVRIPSRPFLRPTWLLIQKKLVKDVTKLLGEEILK